MTGGSLFSAMPNCLPRHGHNRKERRFGRLSSVETTAKSENEEALPDAKDIKTPSGRGRKDRTRDTPPCGFNAHGRSTGSRVNMFSPLPGHQTQWQWRNTIQIQLRGQLRLRPAVLPNSLFIRYQEPCAKFDSVLDAEREQ